MRKTVTLARGENLTASDGSGSGRSYSLPTWYDPSVGPELRQLAQRGGLSINDVIERHSGHEYQVFGSSRVSRSWAWWKKSSPARA